jgi:predicted Zn-dependent protease
MKKLGIVCLVFLNFACVHQESVDTVEETRPQRLHSPEEEKPKDSDEIVGRLMAAQLAGHFGMRKEQDNLLKYVNLIGQTLIDQAGRPGLKFHFGILDTDSLECVASPGGYVFVSTGLLKELQSEHELAGWLATQIAHVNERHYRSLFVTEVIGIEGEVSLSEGRQIEVGTRKLLSDGLDPQLETEADSAAAVYLATTGYSPKKWVDGMAALSRKPGIKSLSMRRLKERAAFMNAFLTRNGLNTKSTAWESELEKRFQSNLKKILLK